MIEAAEAVGLNAAPASAGQSEIEVVLIGGQVEVEGEKVAKVQSLGKVAVAGAQVVVSEDGFVTALGECSPARLPPGSALGFADSCTIVPLRRRRQHTCLLPPFARGRRRFILRRPVLG